MTTDTPLRKYLLHGGWPFPSWAPRCRAESSYGPVVVETPLEALQRRVKHAAAHPLKEAR